VYEVLSRKRSLTLAMVRRLHQELSIPAESLIKAEGSVTAQRASSHATSCTALPPHPDVMRELDPRIQLSSQNPRRATRLRSAMDPRIKPAGAGSMFQSTPPNRRPCRF
jgi:hypothetical protein